MELQLKKFRKAAKLNQQQMADKLGVLKRTYGSWERQEVEMSLKQAFECAVILGCSIDDLVGYTPPIESRLPDPKEFLEEYSKSDEAKEIENRHRKEISSMILAGDKNEQLYKDPGQEELIGYYESMNDEGKKKALEFIELIADSDKVRIQKKPEGVHLPPEMEGIA